MQYKFHLILFTLILASSKASHHDRSIIRNRKLPDSDPITVLLNSKPEIPEHCLNRSVCEDVPNYPHEYVDHILRHNVTVRKTLLFMSTGLSVPVGCKDGKDPIQEDLCPSIVKRMEPKAGRDMSGKWYFLIGGKPLCIEICEDPDKPCKRIGITVITGYKATCKQKMIKQTMAALDEIGAVKPMHLPIESGCCCHLTQDYPLLTNT